MGVVVSMRNPIVFIIWYLTYTVFYYVISRTVYNEKHILTTSLSSFCALLYLIAKFTEVDYWIVLIGVLAVIIAMFKQKKDKYKLLGTILLENFLLFVIGTSIGLILVTLPDNKFEKLYSGLQYYEDYLFLLIISVVIIISGALLFSGIIKLVINKRKNVLQQQNKYIFFLWLPITHVITFIFFMYIFADDPTKYLKLTTYAAGFTVVIFMFDLITFLVVEKYEQIELKNKQYEKQILKNELDYQRATLINERENEVRKIRHDLNNILVLVKGYIEIKNYNKAIEIIENTTNDLNTVKGVPLCSNKALNTILYIKNEQAKEQNSKFDITIEETASINISDYDLCRIVGNLTDNALEAVSTIKEKDISISVIINSDDIIIETKNKFDPRIKKTFRKNRGNGKNIITEIAKKYNGYHGFKIEDDCYITTTKLQNINKDK